MRCPASQLPADVQFVGDLRTMEVHDVTNEKPRCGLPETIDAGYAITFLPDTITNASDEGFSWCPYCIGAEADSPVV